MNPPSTPASSQSAQEQRSIMEMVFADPTKPINLAQFRNVLIRQEETIIFALIERAQFVRNSKAYTKGSDGVHIGELRGKFKNFDGSFLDLLFQETEKIHAIVRRYTSPDEHPFYAEVLPEPILPQINYPTVIQPNSININDQIMSQYIHKILPKLTKEGEDPQSYGSTVTCDIAVLQALSKRIHFGKFIAEAKFRAEKEKYSKLINANDAEGIMEALTNTAVEQKVSDRVELKASTYGQDIGGSLEDCKVDPTLISTLYRDFVMPLTKEVQVAYLLQRLNHPSVSFVGNAGSICHTAVLKHFGAEPTHLPNYVPEEKILTVFNNVLSNKTALGVVPFENSRRGMEKETQQLLISSSLNICAEVYVQSKWIFAWNNVLSCTSEGHTSVPDNWIEQFQYLAVAADAESIATQLVESHYNHSIEVKVFGSIEDTIHAVKNAKSGNVLALLTPEIAKEHKLETYYPPADSNTSLSSNRFIDNTTTNRFAVISKRISEPSAIGKSKSCLWLSVVHESGGLLSALKVFEQCSINICNLQSIPSKEEWKYDFFLEIEGHRDDLNVSNAIKKLEGEHETKVRCIGSYAAK